MTKSTIHRRCYARGTHSVCLEQGQVMLPGGYAKRIVVTGNPQIRRYSGSTPMTDKHLVRLRRRGYWKWPLKGLASRLRAER